MLSRNRYYAGDRPHHVDRIIVSIGGDAGSLLDRVEQGQLDYAFVDPSDYLQRSDELRAKYGINKGRFFTTPGLSLRMFVLNTSRPLFRNNPKLRQAVNFAADRTAILRERGLLSGYLTDQYLPPFMPGFRDERIYPLKAPTWRGQARLPRAHAAAGKPFSTCRARPPAPLPRGRSLPPI